MGQFGDAVSVIDNSTMGHFGDRHFPKVVDNLYTEFLYLINSRTREDHLSRQEKAKHLLGKVKRKVRPGTTLNMSSEITNA